MKGFATMKSTSLDGLRNKVDNKYEALEIETEKETFSLRPILRCPKNERDLVLTKLEELGKDDGEGEDTTSSVDRMDSALTVAREVISIVTANKRGKALVALLGDDFLLVMEVLNQWQEATQPGEASSSQD